MSKPDIDVLAHSDQHPAKEPTTVTASSTGLEEAKVILLAFEGSPGTGAGILMGLPKATIPRDAGVEVIVFLGIGVDDATIGRV